MKLNQKAQSQIIETLLVLLITVVASTIVYSNLASSLNNQRLGPLQQVSERIAVEDIWFHNSTGVKIYLRNTGTVDIKVTSVTVDSISLSIIPSSLTLNPNAGGWVNCTRTSSWTTGRYYEITIISDRGSRFVTSTTPQ